jgi:hypothetical protein
MPNQNANTTVVSAMLSGTCRLEPDKDRVADERQAKGADETGLEHGLLLGESSVRRLRLKVSGYINPALLAIP